MKLRDLWFILLFGLPILGIFYHIAFDPNEITIIGPPAEVHPSRYGGRVNNDTATVTYGNFDHIEIADNGTVTVTTTPVSFECGVIWGAWVVFIVISAVYQSRNKIIKALKKISRKRRR